MVKARKVKIKDRWREKKWLMVVAPQSFGGMVLASFPTTNPEKALGRVLETTLFDLLKQDPQQYTIKLFFQVTKAEGDRALTILKGQEYSRDYLRSLVRRGSSMVSMIRDYTTIDGFKVRVYVIAFTQFRINSSRKRAIREAAHKVVSEKASNMTYDQFSQEVVYGKTASDILNEAKKVTHIRHIGVRKIKIMAIGKPEIKVEQVTQAS
ncbi:MAG: 30S ribosomal protein S3ae [archaeon]|nr:30S ribosomal protein S3ae [archaeon]